MRKYKSKFMKPYIRKLKAGDLKRITSQMTFQALLNECIIDYARQYKKTGLCTDVCRKSRYFRCQYEQEKVKKFYCCD